MKGWTLSHMANSKYKEQTEAAKARRREAGAYVRKLRTEAGLTQRELSEKLNLNYYTFISQVESGAARVPPEQCLAWAAALGVDGAKFSRNLFRCYDPHMFEAVFSSAAVDTKPDFVATITKRQKGVARR